MIFDFNGVIAADETPHLHCFQQALAEHALSLTKDDYYSNLAMDERTCAAVLLAARDGTCDRDLLRTMMDGRRRASENTQPSTSRPSSPTSSSS
jgi:beta-phosphoglucomutase-like phosphatase (HAD superfamily)